MAAANSDDWNLGNYARCEQLLFSLVFQPRTGSSYRARCSQPSHRSVGYGAATSYCGGRCHSHRVRAGSKCEPNKSYLRNCADDSAHCDSNRTQHLRDLGVSGIYSVDVAQSIYRSIPGDGAMDCPYRRHVTGDVIGWRREPIRSNCKTSPDWPQTAKPQSDIAAACDRWSHFVYSQPLPALGLTSRATLVNSWRALGYTRLRHPSYWNIELG